MSHPAAWALLSAIENGMDSTVVDTEMLALIAALGGSPRLAKTSHNALLYLIALLATRGAP